MNKTSKSWAIATALLVAVGMLTLGAKAADATAAKGSVKGKVLKADGTPAAGVDVRLMVRPEKGAAAEHAKTDPKPQAAGEKPNKGTKGARHEAVAQATTDAHGQFALSDVPAGQYVLAARLKGAGSARETVVVQSGSAAADVTLTLKDRPAGAKPPRKAGKGAQPQASATHKPAKAGA